MICINPEIIYMAPAVKVDLGKEVERSPFKPQYISRSSSEVFQADSMQQSRDELQHKILLLSWIQALGLAICHLMHCVLSQTSIYFAIANGSELGKVREASTVPGARLSTKTSEPTFIL